MKQLLLQLAEYHLWVNRILFKRLSALPGEVLNKDMVSSFRGLNKTLFHLMTAEAVWWQRIQLQEHVIYPDESYSDDFAHISGEILRYNKAWIDFIKESGEHKLQHVFEYRNSKREAFKQPVYEVLLHVFNHQTYHVGQMITMLRQQGIDKLPGTDFSEFIRKKGRA